MSPEVQDSRVADLGSYKWICPRCGALNDPFSRFCKGCGEPRSGLLYCENGHPNPPFFSYCSQCGRPLKPERPTPTSDRDTDFEKLVRIYVGRKVGIKLSPREPIPLFRRVAVGGYECRSYLKMGGFCATLLAVDERGVSQVLKIPRDYYEYLEHGGDSSRLRLSGAQLGELYKERGAMERVSRLNHPCIVQYRGMLELPEGGPLVLVFEYCEGGSLRDALTQGPLGPRLAAEVVVQVADALRRIHELGLAHGDVKPENILFTRDSIPKLADFGSARAIASTVSTKVPFTPGYAAPEHVRGGRPVPKSDVWSLALVLYEAATGKSFLPLDPSEYEKETGNIKKGSPLSVNTGDKELDGIIMKCLAVDPEKRPTMLELEHMLLKYLHRKP